MDIIDCAMPSIINNAILVSLLLTLDFKLYCWLYLFLTVSIVDFEQVKWGCSTFYNIKNKTITIALSYFYWKIYIEN